MKQSIKNKLQGGLAAVMLVAVAAVGMIGPMSDPGPAHQLGHVLELEVAAMTNAAQRDVLFKQGYELTDPVKIQLD